MGKKILNQVVQVKQARWQAFAPCFLGVWLCKNFSNQGLMLGGCGVAGKLSGELVDSITQTLYDYRNGFSRTFIFTLPLLEKTI